MRRLLSVLALMSASAAAQILPQIGLPWPGPGAAGVSAITIVQHRSANCVAASCALAFTSNPTAGNTLFYLCAGNLGTALSAATDNNLNTILNANAAAAGGAGNLRIDYVSSANSGATAATCSQTSANRVHIHIWEISGLTTKAFDVGKTATQAATSQTITTTSPTTVAAEIVVGFFYDQPTNDTLTAGSGFSPFEFQDGGAGNESSLSEVKIVSSIGTQTATATSGSATNAVTQDVATFK